MPAQPGFFRAAIVGFLLGLLPPVHAAPPATLTYQGYLTSSAGTPVSGNLSVSFKLYTAASGGTALWSETQSVTVTNGLYSVVLGAASSLGAVAFDQPYWLGVTIGTDAEMTPRQPLTSVPYSFRAAVAESATTAATATVASTANTANTAQVANALSGDALALYGVRGGIPARTNSLAVVDGESWVGLRTAAAVGTDGLPIVVYEVNSDSGSLRVTHCGNAACTAGNITTAIDTTFFLAHPAISIGIDGLPVISYYDGYNGDLKLAHCGNAACSSGNILTVVDSGGNVGRWTSIAIGADGLPVISYADITNGLLKVAHCGNSTCSYGNTLAAVDSVGPLDQYQAPTSIAIGGDGLPVISYFDINHGYLRFAHCRNATCSGTNDLTTVDSSSGAGSSNELTVGIDGLAVIAYFGPRGLTVAHCGDANCVTGNTFCTVDFGAN